MVLPVIAASLVAWSIRSTILLAIALGLAAVFVGLAVAYYADLAPGGAIVLTAAGSYVLVGLGSAARRRLLARTTG
jgi:zinc transport system permease protein